MKILLADEERLSLYCLKDCVSAIYPNAELDFCEDGLAAWEMAQRKQYDLVITDIFMQRMNGDELAKRIHERSPNTQILFETREKESILRRKGFQIERCIFKPYGVSDIREKTEHLDELPDFEMGPVKQEAVVEDKKVKKKSGIFNRLFGTV